MVATLFLLVRILALMMTFPSSVNTKSLGADVTGLLPRVFTIVRGQLFCGVVSLAIVPWKLLSMPPES